MFHISFYSCWSRLKIYVFLKFLYLKIFENYEKLWKNTISFYIFLFCLSNDWFDTRNPCWNSGFELHISKLSWLCCQIMLSKLMFRFLNSGFWIYVNKINSHFEITLEIKVEIQLGSLLPCNNRSVRSTLRIGQIILNEPF